MGNNAVRPVAAGDQYSSNTSTTTAAGAISVLAQHLYHFEITSQVPDDLSKHVTSTKETQRKWYEKISNAWRESKPPPNTPEQVSSLLMRILNLDNIHPHDLKGLLSFYNLPFQHSLVEITNCDPPLVAKGLKFSLHTLPVDPKAVQDGDGMIVYVSAQESLSNVPQEIQMAVVERNKARAERNYVKADALLLQIKAADYGLPVINNEQILAQKYRIRLRGIDAPEMSMPYGKEAKDELIKIIGGKCLTILIFDKDQYGRFVGDIYCNGIFVQESMLKKGLAWHYTFHDKRLELAKWEKDARAKRIGLWASSKPEKPWEWRKKQKQQELDTIGLKKNRMAFENGDGDVLVFITAPRGHVWRMPTHVAQLPELNNGQTVECVDAFNRTHIWGLLEEEGRRWPNLTVCSGWAKFMRMNEYIPGTEIWFIFNRYERKFYVSWDDVNDFNNLL